MLMALNACYGLSPDKIDVDDHTFWKYYYNDIAMTEKMLKGVRKMNYKHVPEEFLEKFDRKSGTVNEVKISDIRSFNIWNRDKTSKEMTDMDEYLRKLFLNASVSPNEILPRRDVSVFAAITPVKIVFNNPATVVFWKDGTKTVVKRQKGTPFNKYYGYLAALGKKLHGSTIKVERLIEQIGIEEKPVKKTKKKEG